MAPPEDLFSKAVNMKESLKTLCELAERMRHERRGYVKWDHACKERHAVLTWPVTVYSVD